MIRRGSIVLGVALLFLWAIGLRIDDGAEILWFDLVAAVVAFGIAALEREDEIGATRGLTPAILGLGLGALWIGGLATGQPRWAAWANFIAACAFLGLAIAAASRGRHALAVPQRRA
jgi:hypothetical protein